jgi:hypothetical protein
MPDAGTPVKDAKATLLALLSYCQANDWSGYDPYDALNSRLFGWVPFLDSRIPRLALTQFLKRSPVNLRAPLLVPKTQNAKAIALFLMAFVKLARLGLLEDRELTTMMAQRLKALRSDGEPYWCWGYSFPWQTRTILVPRGAPNLVCTTFVGNALLDAFENLGDSQYLDMAASAAKYIHGELLWTGPEVSASLSYPVASSRVPVHNANFLGAAFLCRVFRHSAEKGLLDAALKVARYSASRQHDDGSWDYGESPNQHWVDNFHTGYNLCALRSIGLYADTPEFEFSVRRGFEFYRAHFFANDGPPGYFSDRTYPVDIHCVAQSIITLLAFRDLDASSEALARSVLEWAMTHMWNSKGYFYYQVLPFFTNRISYMRWSQAWMLLSLATMLESERSDGAIGRSPDEMTPT